MAAPRVGRAQSVGPAAPAQAGSEAPTPALRCARILARVIIVCLLTVLALVLVEAWRPDLIEALLTLMG